MKTSSWTTIFLVLATAAVAVEPQNCKTMLTPPDIAAALGQGVRIQPVFSGGGQRGWRLYNVRSSRVLSASSIPEGSLMTHVCRVHARDVFVAGGDVCCAMDASREFEATVLVMGKERSIRVQRETGGK